jgi:hypothetical protein
MAKRNHHLQPKFYLKGFSANPDEKNPKIWIYEKGKSFNEDKKQQLQNPKHRNTEKAARKRDYYTFVKDDETKEYEKYENILRDEFEEPAKPIFEKLRQFKMIDSNEKKIFSKYVASMAARGDWTRSIFKRTLENWIKDYDKKSLKTTIKKDVVIAKVTNQVNEKEFKNKEMLVAIENLSQFFQQMNWRFLLAPIHLPFLTNDNPVCFSNLNSEKSELLFPLSSRITLLASWSNLMTEDLRTTSESFLEISDNEVESIRKRLVSVAIKEVYYSQKREWLVKFINNRLN